MAAMTPEQQQALALARARERAAAAQTDAIPAARVPEWGQESPGLYRAASTARDVLGPAVEVGLPVAGAVIGAGGTIPSGPGALLGGAAGAGLGQGLAGELLYQADVALGRREPRSVMETITEPIENIGYGAATELAVPAALGYAGKKLGGLVDAFRGTRTDIKARNLLRESLTAGRISGAEPMTDVLSRAPQGLTAMQAGADLGTPTFQALGQRASKQKGAVDQYEAIISNRVDQDVANLAELAGGVSNTELKAAQDAAKARLNLTTTPQREGALKTATETSENIVQLRGEAATAREAATTLTEDVRRFAAAKDRAAVRAGQFFPVEGMPRIAGRYSYMGDEMLKLADDRMTQAASGSLKFGDAARFRETALDSLESAGLQPLEGQKIADAIRALTKDPRYAGMAERNIALNRVASDIEQWTNSQGIIDADALDAIRKNSVNAIFESTNLAPKAKAKAVAKTMNEIRPLLVDAVENAGGAGYRDYLQAYANGMDEIAKKELFGVALDLYRSNPSKFVKLVEGDAPKIVEKTLGYKNYDIAETLGDDAMNVLREAAKTITSDKQSVKLAAKGQDALVQLLRENLPLPRLPSFIDFKAALGNQVIDALERKVGTKVMERLGQAYTSGKSASDLLKTLSSYERFQLMSAINDPKINQFARSSIAFGVPQTIEAANQLLSQPPQNQNQLAR